MLRILHVSPAYYPATRYGGPIRSVHGLCAALARRGHDVHVITTNLNVESKLDVPIGQPVQIDGVQVRYFDVPRFRRLCWSPGLRDAIEADIAGFDVVHLQSVFLWPTYVAARIAEARGVPYLISPRGMLVEDLIRRKSGWAKRVWIHLFERRSLKRAAAIHSTSEVESIEASRLFPDLPLVACIPNGVCVPDSVLPLAAGRFAAITKPYALFLSRISWKKGIDHLLRAARHVPGLNIVVAGNDDEGITAELKKIAQEEGVGGRVNFVGPAADEEKWALFREAEMFVLPSYSENFGNVVAEAMAMSCPVIVTPEVGLAPLVSSHQAGIVCAADPETLGQAMHQLHVDALLRERMGRAGRQVVELEFSWDGIARQFEELYALSRGSRPAGGALAGASEVPLSSATT